MIVRKLEALFTINTNVAQFNRATSELDRLAAHAEAVMKTIAGYWAVQALQNFVANTAKAMAEVGKSAEYLGITAEALQELHYAAERSGVSVEALNDAVKEIQVRATDARSGQGEAAEAFRMLGLSSTDAAGRIREPLELLDAVADRLKALPSHSERIWIADAIFGDEGSTVLKMLKDGSVGLNNLRKEARALGLTLGSDSIAKANRFNQALTKFHRLATASGRAIVQTFLPPLTWLMERCAALSVAFNQMDSKASFVRVTLLSLGSVLAAFAAKAAVAGIRIALAFSPTLLLFGVIAAAIATVALVIDDLWVAFQGGESVTARSLKKCVAFFKGLGGGAQEAWHAMTKGFGDAWASMQRELSTFSSWLSKTLHEPFSKISFANWVEEGATGLDHLQEKFSALGSVLSATFVQERFAAFQQGVGEIADVLSARMRDFFAELGSIKQKIADSLNFIQEKFAAFQDWITGTADALKEHLANIFDGLMPDFVKKGFLATIKHVSSPISNSNESQSLNARLAPTPANVLHQNRVSTNQSVSVAVNVTSGANPHNIGGEVARAVKKELERERFNAFMGVTQYAG